MPPDGAPPGATSDARPAAKTYSNLSTLSPISTPKRDPHQRRPDRFPALTCSFTTARASAAALLGGSPDGSTRGGFFASSATLLGSISAITTSLTSGPSAQHRHASRTTDCASPQTTGVPNGTAAERCDPPAGRRSFQDPHTPATDSAPHWALCRLTALWEARIPLLDHSNVAA